MSEITLESNQFVLPSGKIATKQPLKGRDFFAFQRTVQNAKGNAEIATQQIMVKMFLIDGEKLDIDALDELDFEDVAALTGSLNKVFQPFQGQQQTS